MIADIFYPIFILTITILACFIQRKKNCLSALHPRLQQGITLDTLGSLQIPPPDPSCNLIWLLQNWCAHIFSVLSPVVWIKNKHKCSFFLQFISVTYSWHILQFHLKKSLNLDLKNAGTYLTWPLLTLWYIEFGHEKYSDYLGLDWLYLFMIYLFLPFNIVLSHAAFTAPSFGNLCMMISPSTLLCLLCSPGYLCHCHICQ